MADSYAELKALRQEMDYSIGEMAALLGISKATYQGYETAPGKAAHRRMPAGFINRVREWQQIEFDFFAGMDDRIRERMKEPGFEIQSSTVGAAEAVDEHHR